MAIYMDSKSTDEAKQIALSILKVCDPDFEKHIWVDGDGLYE